MIYSDLQKMQTIGNINNMRNAIGLNSLNIEFQLKKSYEELFNYQNELIQHYNEALKNNLKK